MIPYCILVIEDDDDREFMTNLFLEYQRLMYSEIYKIVRDIWSTEDIMQSTLVKLIDKIPLLRSFDRNHLVNYVISASKNTAINHLKKEKRVTVFSFDDCLDSPADLYSTPLEDRLEQLELENNLNRLHQIWPDLDERSKFLLEGRYILKKTPEEMARDLDIKVASLRMALTRAKRSAKKLMISELSNGSKK